MRLAAADHVRIINVRDAVVDLQGWRQIAATRFDGHPSALDLRMWGLATPQGPTAYRGGLYAADWPELAEVKRVAMPDGLVATNLPGQVAWYAQRSAVALPAEPEDLLRIDERHPVDTLLLSRLSLGELENTPAWKPLLADPAALRAFAAKGRWVATKDFGSSVVLVRAIPAPPKPTPARKARKRRRL